MASPTQDFDPIALGATTTAPQSAVPSSDDTFDPVAAGATAQPPDQFDPIALGAIPATESGHPKYEVADVGTPKERNVLTREGFKEENANKTWGDTISNFGSGLKNLVFNALDKVNEAGRGILGPSDLDRAVVYLDELNHLEKGSPRSSDKDLGLETMPAKQIPGTALAAIGTLPELGIDVAKGSGKLADKALNTISMPSDEAHEANQEINYNSYRENEAKSFGRSKGETNLGDLASSVGVDRKYLDPWADQGVADVAGLFINPSFAVTKAGKVLSSLIKAGKVEDAIAIAKAVKGGATVGDETVKVAESMAPKTEIVNEIKPPEIKTAQPIQPAVPPAEAPTAMAQAQAAAQKASAPVVAVEKAVAESPQEAGKIEQAANKISEMTGRTADFGRLAMRSPSTAAVVMAGKGLDLSGRATGAMLDVIEKHPYKSVFMIDVGKKLSEGEDLPDALYHGALAAAMGGWVTGHSAAGLEKASSALSEAGRTVVASGRLLNLSLEGDRGMAAIAARLPEGSKEQSLFKLSALGPQIHGELTGVGAKPMEILASNLLKTGAVLVPEIIDPAIRGAVIGGGLQFVASGGDIDQASSGAGMGFGLGIAGHQFGNLLDKNSSAPQLAYIGMRMRELAPEVRTKLLQTIIDKKMDVGSVATLLEFHDLIRPSDGNINFLNAKDFGEQVSARLMENNPQSKMTADIASKQRGFYVESDKNGNRGLYVNLDNMDSATLPHEGFHIFEGLGRFEKFGKNKKPIGDDHLEAPKQNFMDALMGSESKPNSGLYTQDEMADFYRQYYQKLGTDVPIDPKTNLPLFGPVEKGKILSELWADGGGQFMERATKFSNGEGILSYAKMINSMDLGSVRELINSSKATGAGNRVAGESALFTDSSGVKIKNSAEMEKAYADFILRLHGSPGRSSAGEGFVQDTKVDEKELVDKISNAIQTVRESKYSNNVPAIDAANRDIIDLIKTNLYKTRPKPPVQIIAEAKERAERIYGKGNVDAAKIEESKPFIPSADIMNDRNVPMQPGEKPKFLSAKERSQIDANLMDNVFKALAGTSAPDEGSGLMRHETKDGKEYYEGSHITDDQMNRLDYLDANSYPQGMRSMIRTVNDALKYKTGQVFKAVYFKGIEKLGNIRKSFRVFTPTSIMFTKEGNVAMTVFDIGSFNKAIEDLGVENPNSPYLKPFSDPLFTTPEQTVNAFKESVGKYNINHAEGKPGETGLDADPKLALAKKNAINGFFGISEKEVNPLASDKNYYRTFRFDRTYGLQGADAAPFTIPYNEQGQRLQELNFMPGEVTTVNKTVEGLSEEKMMPGGEPVSMPASDFSLNTSGTLPDGLVDFVKKEEGFSGKAFKDFKQNSIGYGTRAKSSDEKLTKEQAEERLQEELQKHFDRINQAANAAGLDLTENQISALTSFDFNTGKGVDVVSTSKDLDQIKERMAKYVKAGGKTNLGLVRRRDREVQLFSEA